MVPCDNGAIVVDCIARAAVLRVCMCELRGCGCSWVRRSVSVPCRVNPSGSSRVRGCVGAVAGWGTAAGGDGARLPDRPRHEHAAGGAAHALVRRL